MTDPKTQEVVDAARVAMDELEEGGSLVSVQRLRAALVALNPSPLPSDEELEHLFHSRQFGYTTKGLRQCYAHALRLAVQEGGQACDEPRLLALADEMENR